MNVSLRLGEAADEVSKAFRRKLPIHSRSEVEELFAARRNREIVGDLVVVKTAGGNTARIVKVNKVRRNKWSTLYPQNKESAIYPQLGISDIKFFIDTDAGTFANTQLTNHFFASKLRNAVR